MKRSRAPNFTTAEIMLLLRLVEKYPIIENKKTDSVTARDKNDAWQNLAAEYNSQTSYSPRTAENLMACYKNQKIKVKKMHSNEKMAIKAPLLLQAVEDHGQDWEQVAQATNESSTDCQTTFNSLVVAAKKEEASYQREINRTGGGPAPQPSCSHNDQIIFDKVKTLIGPSLEGLYTCYGGDAEFMKEQQELLPSGTQISTIEDGFQQIGNDCTPLRSEKKELPSSRLNLMKKKIDPSLETNRKGKKIPVSVSFQELAEDKKKLVDIQMRLAETQLKHEQLKIEYFKKEQEINMEFLKQEKELQIEIMRCKREIELEQLEFLRRKHKIDLELLKK